MSNNKNIFITKWTEEPPREGSYRSIFKWGDPKGFKHPNDGLYSMFKSELGMTDNDFKNKKRDGKLWQSI